MLIQLACLTPQFCKWTFFTWNISVIFRTFQKKLEKTLWIPSWLVVWNIAFFSPYWECHQPNWHSLHHFSEGSVNHQPARLFWWPLCLARGNCHGTMCRHSWALRMRLSSSWRTSRKAPSQDVSKPLVSCERWWFPRGFQPPGQVFARDVVSKADKEDLRRENLVKWAGVQSSSCLWNSEFINH